MAKSPNNYDINDFIRDGRAPIPESVFTSRLMSANKGRNTKPEITLRKAIWINGIKGYRLHWKKVPGRPDITFPGKKIAIFVNGCYWHRCPQCKPHFPKTNKDFWDNKFAANAERDKRKVDQLTKNGWRVITIWECQIKDDLEKQIDMIFKTYYE